MTAHLAAHRLSAIMVVALIVLVKAELHAQQLNPPPADLLEEFERTGVFWRQLEVAKRIVALRDTRTLTELETLVES